LEKQTVVDETRSKGDKRIGEFMSVYVDGEQNQFGRMKMCHMVADTLDELHEMAQRIGLKREWFQVSRNGTPHYDICQSKRTLAVSLGAQEIDRRKMVELARRHRKPV
jgi:Protein of unknown function (DUF4031)